MLRRRGQISGSVAVVTGASSGVGRAAARALAEHGASVVLAARSEPDLEDAARECRAADGRALVVPTDVGDEAAVRALADRALDAFGRIDVWINDAGVIAYGHFEDIPSEAYERVIRTNLLGEIYGARAALEAFHEQRSGVLINLSSLWGRVTSPYVSPYVVSKFGVRAFSECLRQGLRDQPDAKDIHVCTILPESIDTPIFRHAANYSGRSVEAVPPIADPQRVVRAILRCIERPKPETTVGVAGHLLEWGHAITPPRLYNRIVPRVFDWAVFGSSRVEPTAGNLFSPMAELNQVDGGWRKAPAVRWRRRAAVGGMVAAPLVAAALATRGNDGAKTLTRKGGRR